MPASVEDQLIRALDEAYAMEKQVQLLLQSMIRTTKDPSLSSDMKTHLSETEEHAERLATCLEAHGATEHLEIAAYRLIEELAKKANDQQSMAVARQNADDEKRMAARIAANWSKFVALDMKEQGIS